MQERVFVPEYINESLPWFYTHGLLSLFEQGEDIQEQVLEDLIELGCSNQYAKDHGFFGISSKKEFLEKVPISEYDDYITYIHENMLEDKKQLISCETQHYLLSTGQENTGKYYIETQLGALARQLTINLWNLNLARLVPKMQSPNIKMLAVTNCSPIENAANGKVIRRTSGQAAKELWEDYPERYVFPYEFLEIEMSDSDRDYLTALYALKEPNLAMVFCNNLGYFGELLDIIEQFPTRMIEDIKTGIPSVLIDVEGRTRLEKIFCADSHRAEVLDRILKKEGVLKIDKIWPAFDFVGLWMAGSVGAYSRDVKNRLPEKVRFLSESYGSSEAMINIPLEFDLTYGPLAVYACYFEFLPIIHDKDTRPLSIAEVQNGEYYEIIISTYSGLYRYNLHDVVCIRGFTGNTPNVEFCCRSSESVQLGDYLLQGITFIELVRTVEKQFGVIFSFYQVLEESGRMALILQMSEETVSKAEIFEKFCEEAKKEKVSLTRIYWVKVSYRRFLYDNLKKYGRTVQCIKLPMIAQKAPDSCFVKEIYDINE